MIEVFTPALGLPILVDIVGDFAHEKSAELTDYPVEDGSSRSDHKIINPDTVTISIKQTEHPIDDPQYAMLPLKVDVEPNRIRVLSPFLLLGNLASAGLDAALGAIGIGPPAQGPTLGYQTLTPRDRGAELWDVLSALHDSDETCSVSFKGRSVANMSVISVSKTDTTGEGLVTGFQVSLRELRKVTLTSIALPNPADLAQKASKVVGQAKVEEVPAAEVPATSRSVLKSAADLIGSLGS